MLKGRGVAVGQHASEPTGRTPGPAGANGERARQALLAEVYRTRSRAAQLERETQKVATHQTRRATPQTLLRARLDTLEALENYRAALSLCGWPIPSRMALEIHLLRSLAGYRTPLRDPRALGG